MSRQISAATFLNTLKVRSQIDKIPYKLLQFFLWKQSLQYSFSVFYLLSKYLFIYNFNEVLKVSQLLAGVVKFMSRFSSKLVFSYYQFNNRSSKYSLALGMQSSSSLVLVLRIVYVLFNGRLYSRKPQRHHFLYY